MQHLVFATNNQHKLEEVQALVTGHFALKSLTAIGCTVDIPETAETLEGNASLKSQYIWEHYQMDCFADDSGLEVEALNNAPGVYSARYSGTRDMDKNIDLLLKNLGASSNRKACFRTVISLRLNNQHYLFQGIIEGVITRERRGTNGFGYDPIFIPRGYQQSFGEMDATTKNSISHRSMAVKQLVSFLKDYKS